MNNYIKPPMLSTSFSISKKKTKQRLEKILITKRKKNRMHALALFVCVITTICSLVACDSKSSIGINDGTEEPTAIYTSDNYLKKLYGSKIKYIGDNSGVSNILNSVFLDDKSVKKFELKTADDSPKGIIAYLNGKSEGDTLREAKAITVLLLVENCDYIKLSYEDTSVDYTKIECEEKYGMKFSDIIESFDSFTKFYQNIFGLSSTVPIEQRLGAIIIEHNSDGYLKSECQAEGHIILGTESSDSKKSDRTFVYALVTYGEYGFQNDNFIKVSGSGAIPTRITIDKNGNVTEYLVASDGSEYEPSIKKMFPKGLWKRALSVNEADYEICKKQEREYAKSYLDSIDRKAEIGEYSDFEHIMPDMDTDISNNLIDMYGEYPYWIGTEEKIENNVRYVYEKQWDEKRKVVTFKKYEYDTKKIIDETVIDTADGKIIYIKGTPREENHAKIN